MRVTWSTDVRNLARSLGLLLIVRLAAPRESLSFHGPRIDKWHMPAYYTYGYRVYEPKGGEFKDHREFRNGGLIHGSLKVVEKTGAETNITYEGLPWYGWQALIETRDSSGQRPANDASSASSTAATPAKLTIKLDSTESTTSEASSKQMSTEAASKQTMTVDIVLSTGTVASKLTTAKASTKPTSTAAPTDTTSEPSTKPTAVPTLAPKMARIGGRMTASKPWVQIYRIFPSTDPSLRKAPNMHDQIAQSWQNVQCPPARKPAKSSWQNPLYHQMLPMRPSDGRIFTAHGVFPMWGEPFQRVFSARHPPHGQLPASVLSPPTAIQRKRYSIHREETVLERRHNPPYQKGSPTAEHQDLSAIVSVE